jgi:ribonucleoside-diphosphate reductase alpha chain
MDYVDYYWLNSDSRLFLERGYLNSNETAEERVLNIGDAAEKILGIAGFAEKFCSYMRKGYYSLSTPIWTNFGRKRGLPISCYGSLIGDTINSILEKAAEVGQMSKMGGGTSGFFGKLRARGSEISLGGKSDGPVRFMEIFDKITDVVNQGAQRRGSFAAYLPIDHPDIKEFLAIRSEGHPIQNMSLGVTVTNDWMESMVSGNDEKRKIWAKIIKKRFETGYPYVVFIDNVNNAAPQVYKDKSLSISASNLCAEIALYSSEDESFVCDLSSLNLLHYNKWKNTDAVETLAYFLDAVMSEFIQKTESIKFMESARNFAMRQRALGIGVLGWHSYLQSNMIAFESMKAKMLNTEIFKLIKERAEVASGEMAVKFGEPELMKGYNKRNVTLTAIAPTTSSSFILGQVSQSVEPLNSNYFVKKLAKGNFTYKNPFLKNLLAEKSKDTNEIWASILLNGGSVQHLDFLTKEEKDVFKTFGEISQKEVIIQASIRQKYIDQSQSLNVMIHPKTPIKDVNTLLIDAWKLGVKSLYYQRSTNPAQELGRSILTCSSCEA